MKLRIILLLFILSNNINNIIALDKKYCNNWIITINSKIINNDNIIIRDTTYTEKLDSTYESYVFEYIKLDNYSIKNIDNILVNKATYKKCK